MPSPKPPFDKAPRPRAKRMRAADKVARDMDLCRDRASGMGWEKIAVKYKLSENMCMTIWREYKERRMPDLRGKDPIEIVWESVERYEAMYERAADLSLTAETVAAALAAINTQITALGKRDQLLQVSGILPHDLGKLRVEHDLRYIATTVVRILQEDNIPLDTQKKLVEAIRGQQPSPN